MKLPFCTASVLLGAVMVPSLTLNAAAVDGAAKEQLGTRLFHEKRLTNPGSDWMANCANCHIPPGEPGRDRMFADVVPLSLIPSTAHREKDTTLRNTPTLLDAGTMPRLYWDGRYEALEPLIHDKIAGAHFGWSAENRNQALDEIASMVQLDTGEDSLADGTYREAFQKAYDVDVEQLDREGVVAAVVTALADHVRGIETHNTANYDAFAYMNRIQRQVDITTGDTPSDFAGRVEGNLMNQEGRQVIKVPEGWDMPAYVGMKIFYRYYGQERAGNCVQCHYPPRFTDFQFHNTGVTQMAYDALHGEGSFAALDIPAEAQRPLDRFLAKPDEADPSKADLGHWNFADDEAFTDMAGAFKTPTLRDLGYTGPYMHNGAYETLEEVVMHYVKVSRLAREGALPNAPEALKNMYITEEDVPALVAFLEQLNEVPEENYRDLIVEDIHVLTGPFPEW